MYFIVQVVCSSTFHKTFWPIFYLECRKGLKKNNCTEYQRWHRAGMNWSQSCLPNAIQSSCRGSIRSLNCLQLSRHANSHFSSLTHSFVTTIFIPVQNLIKRNTEICFWLAQVLRICPNKVRNWKSSGNSEILGISQRTVLGVPNINKS